MHGGVLAVSWRVNFICSWTVDSSVNLLLLVCTEALCMSRVGGSEGSEDSQSWFLETYRGLWRIPHRRSSLEHADQWEWVTWKLQSAGVLPRGRSASFYSTSLDCLLTQETRDWELTGSTQLVVDWCLDPESRLAVCRVKSENWLDLNNWLWVIYVYKDIFKMCGLFNKIWNCIVICDYHFIYCLLLLRAKHIVRGSVVLLWLY